MIDFWSIQKVCPGRCEWPSEASVCRSSEVQQHGRVMTYYFFYWWVWVMNIICFLTDIFFGKRFSRCPDRANINLLLLTLIKKQYFTTFCFLGVCWRVLGRCWGILGASWGSVGAVLGHGSSEVLPSWTVLRRIFDDTVSQSSRESPQTFIWTSKCHFVRGNLHLGMQKIV